jgi:hypothetical protein
VPDAEGGVISTVPKSQVRTVYGRTESTMNPDGESSTGTFIEIPESELDKDGNYQKLLGKVAIDKDTGKEIAGLDGQLAYQSSSGGFKKKHNNLNVTFTKEIDDVFLDLAKKHFQDENLKLSFYYTSRYQIHEGNIPYLWEHIDQNGTQHTIDLCVIKHNLDDWGIYVEGKLFSEEENQAVFMSASQQIHSRPPYPSRDPEAYIVLLFAVYTKEGHWWRQLDGSQESFLEAIEKYRWDGDIRYYEQKGHVAYFNDIPKENKPCNSNYPNECLDCWVAPEELIKEKMKINKEINESKP